MDRHDPSRRPRRGDGGERALGGHRRPVPDGVPRRPPRREDPLGPRRRGPDPRRVGSTAPLARADARRHGADRGASRAAPGQDEVRRPGGADPGDRLRRRGRRRDVDDVCEPADPGDPRVYRTGVHRRPAAVGTHVAPRRSRERGGHVPARTGVRRSLRLRIPPPRARRQDGVVPRQRDRAQRRAGPPPAHPGRDARHHRTQDRGGADRVPRVPRQAHGIAEPHDVRRAARPRARASEAPRARRRRRDRRPGRLQARERLPRTRGRRHDPRAVRATAQRRDSRDRPRGAAGRGRVPAPALRPRSWVHPPRRPRERLSPSRSR